MIELSKNEFGSTDLPEQVHHYRNHTMDSTLWEDFTPRKDDIVISTAYKAGTTWMQAIISGLVFGDQPLPNHLHEVTPWLDMRLLPHDKILQLLEAQTHRRFIKTHTPLDGLQYNPDTKYVVVARDGRDVFMSLWNHYRSYSPQMRDMLDNHPGRVGDKQPPCPDDIHVLWQWWISKGWFDWEPEGYPFWSLFHHTLTWWTYRHLPNILLVHYNDLLANLNKEMRRVAGFLEIKHSDEMFEKLTERATFANMKENADEFAPGAGALFIGGSKQFIFKGTNGRWKDVLTAEELHQFDEAVAKALPPACVQWLEHGGPQLTE